MKNCEHKWEKQERTLKETGFSYYYYQCTDSKCSEVYYPMDQLQRLMEYSEEQQFMFLEDWIFALFYSLSDSPIVGRTSLQKQIFLLMMEFAQEENIATENIGFYGYKYGPYDDRITDAVDVMIEGSLISKNGRKNTDKERFILTAESIERAKESFDKLTANQKDKLVELRKEYQMLGVDGLLNRVYTYYPEYTHNSKIRRSVLKLKKK